MALLTPPPAAPQRGDRTTFASRVDAFITWLINFVSEMLALVMNLNSLAAGGAYTIPLTLAANQVPIGSNLGLIAPSSSAPSMQGATQLYIDAVDATGKAVKSQLDDVFGSSSASKGYLRLVKQGDPTSWISYRVDGWSYTDGANPYGLLTVSCVGASSVNPFFVGDALIMKCQRTGDKGDNGSSTSMLIRELYASGAAGPSLTSATWTTRVLNTVAANTIPGASLGAGGANTFRLPPGTYLIWASAPAYSAFNGNTLKHQIRLYNRTLSQVTDAGAGETQVTSSTDSARFPNRSVLRTLIAFSTTADFSIDHYVSLAVAGGTPVSTGYGEVYTEVLILKVA